MYLYSNGHLDLVFLTTLQWEGLICFIFPQKRLVCIFIFSVFIKGNKTQMIVKTDNMKCK